MCVKWCFVRAVFVGTDVCYIPPTCATCGVLVYLRVGWEQREEKRVDGVLLCCCDHLLIVLLVVFWLFRVGTDEIVIHETVRANLSGGMEASVGCGLWGDQLCDTPSMSLFWTGNTWSENNSPKLRMHNEIFWHSATDSRFMSNYFSCTMEKPALLWVRLGVVSCTHIWEYERIEKSGEDVMTELYC